MDDPAGDRVGGLRAPRPVAPAAAAGWRAAGWWPDVTLPELLRRAAAARPEAAALVAGERRLSFADLDRESDRVAAGLAALGVGPGVVVSCQLANVPEFVVLHHAVAKRRAIFNPIHLPYRAAEVEAILAFAGARVVVVGASARGVDLVAMVAALRPRLPALHHVVTVGPERRPGTIPFDELGPAGSGRGDGAGDPDEPFLLLFTSGTTAGPKATLHTHNMRLGNARFIAGEWQMSPDDRVLALARLSHMWGLMTYWMALWVGAAHVLLEQYRPEAFARTVEHARATVAVGAPPHLSDLLALPDLRPDGLRSLRLFALSGSVCPPALAYRLRDRIGCTPLMLWGMTETGGGLFTRPDDPPEVAAETVGRPAPGCAVRVVGETGAPVAPGTEGELLVQSPFVFEGYVNDPAATAAAFTDDGWFRTGDVATIDAAGNVRIRGRIKELINRGGVKFHPADVEDVLLRHPGLRAAALVGMPDERLGERNCCFVVPAPGAPPPTLAALTAWLEAAGVAKFKWPERLEVVDALPLTPTGKVQRAVLRRWLEERRPDIPGVAAPGGG
jgi:cyclohexanecarboxylate-CoA ligase